jgi:hypothetical protein
MTSLELPSVLSYNSAVVQQARGQPGLGLTLHLLLQDAGGEDSRLFLQIARAHVWALRDACAIVMPGNTDKYSAFMSKVHASHQLNYGDKFMKTLPSTDVFGRFHRRRDELSIPKAWLETLQEACTGVPLGADITRNGLELRFAMGSGEPLSFHMPHEVVFLLIDTIDHAIWAAEWERDGQPDEAGS